MGSEEESFKWGQQPFDPFLLVGHLQLQMNG